MRWLQAAVCTHEHLAGDEDERLEEDEGEK
jgi:hypothetical protein